MTLSIIFEYSFDLFLDSLETCKLIELPKARLDTDENDQRVDDQECEVLWRGNLKNNGKLSCHSLHIMTKIFLSPRNVSL